ncbi:MAG: SDR family oxidoreductase [Actinomycetota bacterium]|nr:SDR family oxidoreductase [Actinomycetota bacterium]
MAKEPRPLAGKVVAITGGARGIGEVTARSLVREGAKVAIGDLDLDLAEKTASSLGGETIALELDVTRRESFASYLSQVEERLGPVDVLINNAGIMPLGRFVDEDDATARRMIDINLHGLMFGMKLVMPSMMRRRTGHIVNIASQAGKGGFPGGATYCATKHAVVGLSEAVRGELRDTGVEVSVVMPAAVNTELGSGLVKTRAVKKLEPQEVADAIVDALKYPKFDVWVPKISNGIFRFMQLLPRSGREAVVRALKADQVLAGADMSARSAYEQRAARSEPGIEPADAGAATDAAEAETVETT